MVPIQTFFFVEQLSDQQNPPKISTPEILFSTELSQSHAMEIITVSFVASPKPQIKAIESDSNDPTFPYIYGIQHPLINPSLNDINLSANAFIIPVKWAMVPYRANPHNDRQSTQSTVPTELSSISTLSMGISNVDICGTSSDMGCFFSDKP